MGEEGKEVLPLALSSAPPPLCLGLERPSAPLGVATGTRGNSILGNRMTVTLGRLGCHQPGGPAPCHFGHLKLPIAATFSLF